MKLYAVEVSYKAYVLADNEFDAGQFATEVAETESSPDVFVYEVTPPKNPLGWDSDCLVYHETSDKEIKLSDVPNYTSEHDQ